MNALKLFVVSILLFASGNLMAAKAPKVLVCHVSGDGEINLILVSANSNHLGNAKHNFEGLTDYEPATIGASGEGTEDIDGDGIDEGCEPPEGVACPCWETSDLMAVTEANFAPEFSCESGSFLPFAATIETYDNEPGVAESFAAGLFESGLGFCQTSEGQGAAAEGLPATDDEAASCISQIVDRCNEINHPIPTE
jgi:hypothetical protein